MKKDICLQDMEERYVDDLVDIINTDERLREALGSKEKTTTREEFESTIEQWQIRTNSKTFAIVLSHKAIGTISLGHINEAENIAEVGYWIGSSYWNNGYTTEAFDQIMDLARELKIKLITASIKKDNIASKIIWEKFNSEFEEDGERFYPKINL